MNIANYLTFIRVFISPIFFLVYIGHAYFGISDIALAYVLLILLAISELSDFLDGYIARRYNQVTDLGKILDPMADSIARISVFLTFTQPPVQIPLLLVFIFIYRDSVISTLRTVCALRGFALAARPSGKFKAGVQAVVAFAIVFLMMGYAQAAFSLQMLQNISLLLVGIAAVYTLYSGADYIIANRQHVLNLLRQKSQSPKR